jgi:hypothetical protein
MMKKTLTTAALALAAPGLLAAGSPAMAAPTSHSAPVPSAVSAVTVAHQYDRWDRNGRHDRYDRYDRNGRYDRYGRHDRNYGEPVYRNTRVWRGNDGRYYCRHRDGTTGLLIGGMLGGLLGNGIAGRGDRTLGTILGLAGGALLGHEIDSSNSRCR